MHRGGREVTLWVPVYIGEVGSLVGGSVHRAGR